MDEYNVSYIPSRHCLLHTKEILMNCYAFIFFSSKILHSLTHPTFAT